MRLFFGPRPLRKAEVIAPKPLSRSATDVKLRDYFHFNDGDVVEIETFEL
jgi:CTP-dependent riboflavin kinase